MSTERKSVLKIMEIVKEKVGKRTFRFFHNVTIFKGTPKEQVIDCIAEEKFEKYVQEALESNKYYKIKGLKELDETYGYYVPQSIANTENEEEIAYSIEEILDDDGRI